MHDAMDYDVLIFGLVIRMAGRKWDLHKGQVLHPPLLFHSPYGTYKAIVEPSAGMSEQNRRRVADGPTLTVYITHNWSQS